MAEPGAENEASSNPELTRSVRWYRLSMVILLAAFGLQLLFAGLLVQIAAMVPVLAFTIPVLSMGMALAAAGSALRGMLLARAEFARIGSSAGDVKTRRLARSQRSQSGPVALICILSAVVILASLVNLRTVMFADKFFRTVSQFDSSDPQILNPGLSLLHVGLILNLILSVAIAIGLIVAFLRLRSFRQTVDRLFGG